MDRFERITRKVIVPSDEKPRKMDDYVGRRVCLLRDVQTNGGTKFRVGEVLVVYGHWRGMLHCESPRNPKKSIRRLNRSYVEVLEDGEGSGQRRGHSRGPKGG